MATNAHTCYICAGSCKDRERNKNSHSHTKFDIHPTERRQMPANVSYRRSMTQISLCNGPCQEVLCKSFPSWSLMQDNMARTGKLQSSAWWGSNLSSWRQVIQSKRQEASTVQPVTQNDPGSSSCPRNMGYEVTGIIVCRLNLLMQWSDCWMAQPMKAYLSSAKSPPRLTHVRIALDKPTFTTSSWGP